MKEICRNTNRECIKCTQGPCENRITSTYVKPSKSVGSLTVDVGINGMDETIKQLQALKRLYADIDTLQQRIIKGAERVEQIACRCQRVLEIAKDEDTYGDRPKETYADWSKRI